MAPAQLQIDDVASSLIRVVFADDSPLIRTLAKNALSTRAGMAPVALAADGAAALELVASHRPDCVVLDVEMPGMGGFEALAALQRTCPEVPVVMLSGYSGPEVVDRAMAEGAAAYLPKSELPQLAETIRRIASAPTPRLADRRTASRRVKPVLAVPDDAGADQAADLRMFEYAVSHDLGEPLRIMSGFASLLHAKHLDALDERGQSYLQHIVDGAARMQAMLDDLLVYTRAGKADLHPAVVPLSDAVSAACSKLHATLVARAAVVTFSDRLPYVLGDPEMVATIFRHLIMNAVVFNRSDAPTVDVSVTVHGGSTVVTVSDNGIGIAPAGRERAFDLFQRLNTRDEFPGTGTGLALCRRLARRQGGAMTLESTPTGGTAASFSLPSAADDSAPQNRASENSGTTDSKGSP